MFKSKRADGFSLVELVVTIAIFAVAAAGIFGSMSFALSHQSDSIIRVKEETLARSYFEQISESTYTNRNSDKNSVNKRANETKINV